VGQRQRQGVLESACRPAHRPAVRHHARARVWFPAGGWSIVFLGTAFLAAAGGAWRPVCQVLCNDILGAHALVRGCVRAVADVRAIGALWPRGAGWKGALVRHV